MRRRLVAFGCATVLVAATGCTAFSDGAAVDDGGTVTVAAAFYPLQYVAGRVGGEHVDVAVLTAPGEEPHDVELTVRETAEVARADLVVHQQGLQAAVDDAVAQTATGEILDAVEVVDLVPLDAGHEAEGNAEDGGSHEGHDHALGDLDPHFWLDPLRMAELGDAVAGRLAGIDPAHAADYRTGADRLRADLEALDRAYQRRLADCERSTVVVSHDAFGYLERYGLEIAPVAGISPRAEPTPADLAELGRLIDTEGITTVFSERLASPRFTRTLAEDAGVQTAVLDPIAGLTEATAGEDYLSLMEQNLRALARANGCR